MPDFWSKVLGNPQPETPQPQTPASDQPWWQRTVMQPPAQQPTPVAPVQPPDPGQPQPFTDDSEASLARTQWSRDPTGNCQGCGSSNYFQPAENQKARPRCFDCGYPLMQSGTGAAVQGKQAGPVQASRQTDASKTNSYNPQNIFHHM